MVLQAPGNRPSRRRSRGDSATACSIRARSIAPSHSSRGNGEFPGTTLLALAEVARDLAIEFKFVGDLNSTFVAGEDVSGSIRTPEISQGASQVSAHGPVRAALLDLQRRLGAGGGVVVEGRDTGTVVFPDAQAKFFLSATDEERARRRVEEPPPRGQAGRLRGDARRASRARPSRFEPRCRADESGRRRDRDRFVADDHRAGRRCDGESLRIVSFPPPFCGPRQSRETADLPRDSSGERTAGVVCLWAELQLVSRLLSFRVRSRPTYPTQQDHHEPARTNRSG